LAPIDLAFSSQGMIHELPNQARLERKQVRDYYVAEQPNTTDYTRKQLNGLLAAIEKRRAVL